MRRSPTPSSTPTWSDLLGTALGGGIYCENSLLSLTNCTVNANQANGANAYGGGIYALDSTVALGNSTVNGNKANGSVVGEGGGIYQLRQRPDPRARAR